jgi:hypothetical protein
LTPQSLNLKGGTQPEIYKGTVDGIAQALLTDPAGFWQNALVQDGPIEIWEINGERWLFNGNHRYQAAMKAGVEIPESQIKIVDMTGTAIPTWRFDQMTWLTGTK